MIIYVVEGSTGEYSAHEEWLVKAYRTEAAAQRMVTGLTEKYSSIVAPHLAQLWNSEIHRLVKEQMIKFDPDFQITYTGAHYTYYEVELADE